MFKISGSRLVGAVSISCLLAATPTGAETVVQAPTSTVIWARANTPPAVAKTDFEDCKAQAQKITAYTPYGAVIVIPINHGGRSGVHGGAHAGGGAHGGGVRGGGGVRAGGGVSPVAGAAAGAVGSLIGSAIAAQMWTNKLRSVFFPRCMHDKGYGAVSLTAAEDGARAKAGRNGEEAWLNDLYAAPAFVQRLATATRTVAALPDVDDDDFTLTKDSMRYDAASFTPASGVVTSKDVVLSGHAGHIGVAKLTEALDITDPSIKLPAGEVFQAVAVSSPDGGDALYWCDPRPFGRGAYLRCFRQIGNYYTTVHVIGSAKPAIFWASPTLVETPDFNDVDIKLEATPADALGPIDVKFVIRSVTDKDVLLMETISEDNHATPVWVAKIPFDADGHAVMPFWTHRLVMTRSGKDGVTATWQADGDGSPPPECVPTALVGCLGG